jgi:hypothetical protein
MTRFLSATGVLALLALSGGFQGVAAQQPLVMYDDFNARFIDPSRWYGQDFGFSETDRREQVREIQGNALRLASRLFSDPASGGPSRNGGSRVRFTQPADIRTIQADVRVMAVEAVGCPTGGAPALARLAIQGFFFRDAAATSTVGNAGMVSAALRVGRASNSAFPANQVSGVAQVFRCEDASCGITTTLGTASLGRVQLQQKATARLEWAEAEGHFAFTLGHHDAVVIPYAVAVSPAPEGSRIIDVSNSTPSCGPSARSLSYVEALVDNVQVNAVP